MAETQEVAQEGKKAFGINSFIPLAFLGLGVYRAWIEIVFVGSFVDFPVTQYPVRDLFDFVMTATLFLCAFLARRTGPFFDKKRMYWLSALTLTISTALVFLSVITPEYAGIFAPISSVLGGIGIAVIILMWSELFGCLNPVRVALYYSASIILGALIVYVYRGFSFPWLFAMTSLLPGVSLIMVARGFTLLPEAERPSKEWARFSLPWKAIFLMAIYAFAYGLMETYLYSGAFGPHSAVGTVVVGVAIFLGVIIRGGKFDFGLIYRLALPLMVGAFILLPSLGILGEAASNLCVSGGYTAFSILIMLILSNICYRYGVSAIWLFGIERGVRALFMMLGRWVQGATVSLHFGGFDGSTIVMILTIFAVIGGTLILFSERELSSRWGAHFLEGGTEAASIIKKQELVNRCDELARAHKLSAREEEVLLLLAQRKTVGIIERELYIANGTAKAHIRHIYQKLDIHSREELFVMLGIDSYENTQPAKEVLDETVS